MSRCAMVGCVDTHANVYPQFRHELATEQQAGSTIHRMVGHGIHVVMAYLVTTCIALDYSIAAMARHWYHHHP